MKKTLIALFVAAFCFSSMAQVLIYDYSVSFKRIDVKQVKTTYKNDNVKKTVKLDSPKVVSDKFVGYVVVDACEKCEGQMTESLTGDNTATVLITRKGAKKADKELYVKNAAFKALMFGAKTGIRTGQEADKINFDKFTDAALWLSYELSWEKNENHVGFLGLDNSSSDKMAMQAGYGKVTKRSTKDKTITTPGDCEDTTETIEGVTCWMVKNIAGSFLADTTYTGICSNFLFDVCDLETPGTTTDAPLPGTFTLKLNNSLTFNKGAFRYTRKEAAVEALKAKLGF